MRIEGSSLHLTTSEAKWIVVNLARDATELARAVSRERRRVAASYMPKGTFDDIVELHIDVTDDDPKADEKLIKFTLAEVALEVAERGYGYGAADIEEHIISVPFDEQYLPAMRSRAELKHANVRNTAINFGQSSRAVEQAFPPSIDEAVIPAQAQAQHDELYFQQCMGELSVTAGILRAIDTRSKE